MFKTTLKGLMAHKLRMVLTALAVVLGVGFIAGTYILTDTMNKTFDNLFSDITEGVDVYVRAEKAFDTLSEDREKIPAELLETVRSVDGVASAEGSIQGYAQLVDKDGEAITPNGPPTIGVNWFESPGGAIEIRSGSAPQGSGEVAIDAGTADKYGFAVGDEIEVLLQGPAESFEVVGIIGFGEADNLAGATLAAFDTATAERVLDSEGEFDAIEVMAQDGVSDLDLESRVAEVLPNGVEASTGTSVASEQSQALQEGLGFFTTALLVFGYISLFVGAFIIFNTFSIVVAQRTREFGLLRAMGATGSQILRAVVIESAIVGVVASFIGLGAGALIAVGLQNLLRAFGSDLPSTTLQFQPRTIVVAMLVGVGVTMLASIAPARRAARISPMAALREASPQTTRWSRRRMFAGGGLTAAGIGLLALGLFGDPGNPAAIVGLGAAVVFFGVAALSPLFAGPLARAIGAPMTRLFHMPGKLARNNADRNPKRTASTAAALMIGLALISMVGILAATIKASTTAIIDENLKADFIISNMGTAGPVPFSPEIARDLAQKPELAAVSPLRYKEFRFEGRRQFIGGVDPATIGEVTDLGVEQGAVEDISDGGLLIADAVASDEGLDVGDTVEVNLSTTGIQEMTVDGIFANVEIVGPPFLVSLETWAQNFDDELDTTVYAVAAEGVSTSEARTAVEATTADFPNVDVENQAEFRDKQAASIDQLLGLITALLSLALLIGVLGITNTLALSVFERTRELGLLRAVGMSRRQARAMVRWEAVIIAIIGALLGLAVGSFFGWALVQALADDGLSELAFPVGQLVTYVVLAGVAGVLAALPPARRAARLNVLQAISQE